MSNCRFMYANLLESPEAVSLSSTRAGLVGMPAPQAKGTAVAYATGDYTGSLDQLFLLSIDSLAAGDQVGQASFSWRRASSDSWEATGVPTSDSFVDLTEGVRVKWSSGPGQDFFLGDAWSILAVRSFGAASLLDGDRDTQWESLGCAEESITWDLGQTREGSALVLADHNLSPAASATLVADEAGDWLAPAFSQDIAVTSPHLVYFSATPHSRRQWRLILRDPANPGGRLSASLLYWGPFFEPSRNFGMRHAWSRNAKRNANQTAAGKLTGDARGTSRSLSLSFQGVTAADAAGFAEMFSAVHQTNPGRLAPLFFTPDPAQPDETLYCLPPQSLGANQLHQGRYSLELSLEEVIRSHV